MGLDPVFGIIDRLRCVGITHQRIEAVEQKVRGFVPHRVEREHHVHTGIAGCHIRRRYGIHHRRIDGRYRDRPAGV